MQATRDVAREALAEATAARLAAGQASAGVQGITVGPTTLAPAASVVVTHNFGYPPDTAIRKQSGLTWVDATGTLDIVDDSGFTTTTFTNATLQTMVVIVRVS
jgi:hypothetical protein